MFEFLFKYPPAAFEKGHFVLLGSWPAWLLGMAVLAAALAFGWQVRRWARPVIYRITVGFLETSLLALLLLLLWHPALSVATLKPQENVVAVLIDDSRSMAIREGGTARIEKAVTALQRGVLSDFSKRFQVRTYRFGKELERVEGLDKLHAEAGASRIADALRQVAAEASAMPIGAVVLLSDGADNSGGIGLDTVNELRRRRIPVHTVGFGAERFEHDVELEGAEVPARTLADSRLSAMVTLRSDGYSGSKVRLIVRDGGKALATREVALKDGEQNETILFNAGTAGAKNLEIALEPLVGEQNTKNNALTRLVNVESARPRVLYIEGEPRWEFKFIRRAIEEDRSLQLVSMLRTTENKIYRQGIDNPQELLEGFPSKPEELFAYRAVLIGSVESGYFTPAQQELLREFVDRRGGGLLFLGGRAALGESGYAQPPFSDLLPVTLPQRGLTFHRDPAKAELTAAGRDSLVCRLLEDPAANAERWKGLPLLADYQEVGPAKPGALVLSEYSIGRRTLPLLVTQNYGHGRTAVFATGGSWRWKMLREHTDRTHQMFWQQLLRWLVAGTPGQVTVTTPRPVLSDEDRVMLDAEVRDPSFQPVADAHVEAHVVGPAGLAETVELRPDAQSPGHYRAEWQAEKTGSYLAEIVSRRGDREVGRDVVMFRREDGVAENFRVEQNRGLLEKLAEQTGGRYWAPSQLSKLARDINYSEAGITIRETRDLWDMPAVFLLALMLRSAEWLLRRRWGVV